MQEFVHGSIHEIVSEMGSYQPVAAVMFPYSISQGWKTNPSESTTTIQKIEVNVPIEQADFAVPASLKQPSKAEENK